MNNDLSEYEQLRLENIKRNEEFLATLGLESVKPPPKQPDVKVLKKRLSSERKANVISENDKPRRRSRRLQDIEAEDVPEISTKTFEPEYEYPFPVESHQLDDFEFQVFVLLRQWRVLLCRELQIEGYKIIQNRTLCELIRRVRDDDNFGANPATRDEELLSVWGLGPAKAAEGGFGWQAMEQLRGEECTSLLDKSRKLANKDTVNKDLS